VWEARVASIHAAMEGWVLDWENQPPIGCDLSGRLLAVSDGLWGKATAQTGVVFSSLLDLHHVPISQMTRHKFGGLKTEKWGNLLIALLTFPVNQLKGLRGQHILF